MKHHADTPSPLVSLNDAARMTSMSRTMVNRLRAAGQFPASVILGERRIAFVRAEVEHWIDAKIAGRTPANDNAPAADAQICA